VRWRRSQATVGAPAPNVIEQTWLAYALDRDLPQGRVEAALERVQTHYARQFAEPLERSGRVGTTLGLVLWRRDDPRLAWPLWVEEGELAAAFSSAPTGWSRIVGDLEPERAASVLAKALAADPDRLTELNPPFVAAVHEADRDRLTIVGDFIGAARLYELRTDYGWIWSNRLGALPLFAGTRPEADPRGWAILAATGWFLGESTAIRGVRKLEPGSIVRAQGGAGPVSVTHDRSSRIADLVSPREADLKASAGVAVEQSLGLVRDAARLFDERLAVDLSGGRDSRLSSAAVISARVKAEFHTIDLDPGEVDVVRKLLSKARGSWRHTVTEVEDTAFEDDLRSRVENLHLVHDGMLNPNSLVRGPMPLPHAGHLPPVISGHGGELGHGFYYETRVKLRRIAKRGTPRAVSQLDKEARRQHSAADESAYAAYLEEVERTMEEGESYGLEGPNLLDYFYLSQRLAFRSGIGARNDRYSTCATPGFVRASFDLEPRQRLKLKLHRMMLNRLLPKWNDVPYFESAPGSIDTLNRQRMWERPGFAEPLREMIDADEVWGDLFDPAQVRGMWDEAVSGEAGPHHERVFMRIAWRSCFEDHLRTLGDAATSSEGPRRGDG
jgi:hypothetical protein